MKVKLIDGKFWKWGNFSIRKGEEKECPDDILQYADGRLEPVKEKKKPTKETKHEYTE